MRVLLDTHALVWGLSAPDSLGTAAKKLITEAEPIASVASLWELCRKTGRKTALVKDPLEWWGKHVSQNAIEALPIVEAHLRVLVSLGNLYGDPFDRIILAQAIVEKLLLVTKDTQLARYGVKTIW